MEQSEAGKPVKPQGNAENWSKIARRHPVFTPLKLFSPSPWGEGKGGRKPGQFPRPKGIVPFRKGTFHSRKGHVPRAKGDVPPQKRHLLSRKGHVPRAKGVVPIQKGHFPNEKGSVRNGLGSAKKRQKPQKIAKMKVQRVVLSKNWSKSEVGGGGTGFRTTIGFGRR